MPHKLDSHTHTHTYIHTHKHTHTTKKLILKFNGSGVFLLHIKNIYKYELHNTA